MLIKLKKLNTKISSKEKLIHKTKKINNKKYDERISNTLTWDENKLNTLRMFQDLTWETWEYNFKNWRWNRLTQEKFKILDKIKKEYDIKIYWTDAKKCEMIWEIDGLAIDNFIRNKQELSKIMGYPVRDLDMILFYSKLAEIWILSDFMKIFDKYEQKHCLLDNVSIFEETDFSKMKEMKEYIKSKNPNTIFDLDTIFRLNSLERIEYVWNILLKWVEKWWENYVILNANKLWTEYIRAEKQWENEYIINAEMPSSQSLAGISYIKLIQSLPEWSRIIEKKSLSINSFNNLITLSRKAERFNVKISFQNKIWLNSQWEIWELAKLIKNKNIWKNSEIFETDTKENAKEIVDKINKLIMEHIWNNSIHAEIKEIEKEWWNNTWWIELPGFIIEK